MRDISFHITDIFQNSVTALATEVLVEIRQNVDSFELLIADNGCGMSLSQITEIQSVIISDDRVRGLGIPLLKQSVECSGGDMSINSVESMGTTIVARFGPQMKLGNLSNTLMMLVVGNPEVEVKLHLVGAECEFEISTSEFKSAANEIPISHPHVAKLIGEILDRQIERIFKH